MIIDVIIESWTQIGEWQTFVCVASVCVASFCIVQGRADSLPSVVHQLDIYFFRFKTLRPRQNGCLFADDTFKCIFLNENVKISIKISLKFVPKVPINNIPALCQIMAWRRSGDTPLSETMMVTLLTHICVTWPQWVNAYCIIVHREQLCHICRVSL